MYRVQINKIEFEPKSPCRDPKTKKTDLVQSQLLFSICVETSLRFGETFSHLSHFKISHKWKSYDLAW